MSIRWITPQLGTGPALSPEVTAEMTMLDVRDLVDKPGNRADTVREKILAGCASLSEGKRTVVCCDYGISRSNAVAVGILARHEALPFNEAVRRVMEATGEREIKMAPLQVVRRALEALGTLAPKSPGGKPRVLITGGTGALGSSVRKRLADSHEVIAPSRAEADLWQGTTQLGLQVEDGMECLIHLANPRIYTSNLAMGQTLTMLRNVLDVCVERDLRLIYLSSWEVYSGYRSTGLLADEGLPKLPKGPYAETKYLCDQLIAHSRLHQGLRCTLLRPSPVYGPECDKPKFIYNFIDKIKRGAGITTHRYSNGLPALDLLYIDDVIEAISLAVGSDYCGDLNLGTGVATSTLRIAEMLREMLGGTNDIASIPIESDTACVAMDASLAKQILGWQPAVDLDLGLRRMLSRLGMT